MKDIIENDFATFYIENDILHFVYKESVVLDLEAAKTVVRDRLKIQNGEAYLVLCDITKLKSGNKAARDYLAKEGSALVKTVALIVDSPARKMMTDFYLFVNRPTVPTRIFTNRSEALKFLEGLKQKP